MSAVIAVNGAALIVVGVALIPMTWVERRQERAYKRTVSS